MVKKAIPETKGSSNATKMERYYFIMAVAVISIAGELVWWQAKTANDYLTEYNAATIYGVVSDTDKHALAKLDSELETAQAELEQFIQEESALDVAPQ